MQAGTADVQRFFIDHEGAYAQSQGVIVKADSGAMGRLIVRDGLLQARSDKLTFERTSKGFPTSIDLGRVANGDHVVVAPASDMGAVLSLRVSGQVTISSAQQADVTEHTFRAATPNGRTFQRKNGIRRSGIP